MDSGYTKEQLEAMGVNTEHLFVFTEERATYNGKVFSIDILIDSLIGVFGPCERIVYGEEYNKGYDHYLWDEIGFVALVSPEKKVMEVSLHWDCLPKVEEYDFIPAVGKSNKEFWTEANTLAEEQDADMVLTYMARMIQEAKSKGLSLRREAFQDSGRRVTLFAGVKEWFSRINAYGAGRGIRILHYINSSGLKEIIEGTEIAHEFRKIYACSFLYDVDGIAYWPAVAVNYTNKTQFIFKINKGVESVFDSKLVNRYIPENERPVPFKHMIYVGDGTTDIPCMRLVKNSGGHSIAVYNPDRKGASKEMASLIHDNRVSHVCPADYTEGSEMDILVKTIIDKIDLDDRLEKLEVVR